MATEDRTGIEAVAALIGDRWAMLVLRDVFRGVRRFDGLCADLGVARPVLVSRLTRLVAAGILSSFYAVNDYASGTATIVKNANNNSCNHLACYV